MDQAHSVAHHYAEINGIAMHYAICGEGRPVVLCHGFPHTWYSWNRQMQALAAAGYKAIAPDMRGMGETEAPESHEAYGVADISGDLIGLLDHLGYGQAIFAGLDFGAFAIYDLALEYPERVVAVIGLENPAAPHNPSTPPLTEYAEMAKNHFLHIEYFRPVGPADADLAQQPRAFLENVFYALSGDYDFAQVMQHPPGVSYLDALPKAPELPWPWLSAEDMAVYVDAYTKSGFTGGLNWYRSMDIKWAHRRRFEGLQSQVPAYFIGSEYDVDLEHFHGDDPIALMRAQFPDLRRVEMIPGAGHLVQLEASLAVNEKLLAILADIDLS